MAKNLLLLAAIIGTAFADGTGHHAHAHDHGHEHAHDHGNAAYAAPSAPQENYGAPSAPADAYGAPADAYGAPAAADAYGAPAAQPVDAYGAPAAQPASAYGAPTSDYGAPAAEYSAPSADYGAPSDAYGAPSDAYGAPQQYAESTGYSDAYATAADAVTGFDLSSLSTYIPFLLAVFAAIIVAQIFGPLLATLIGAKLDLAQTFLQPFEQVKVDMLNAVLAPFDLVLGNIDSCDPATIPSGRNLVNNFNITPDNVLNMIYKASEIYNELS